ncbi:MAG: hypothetical protein LBU05_01040 [Bifidobacteriaceae bacterium]|jgi:hypothetical protein|nr:hypothetical protein [Bifidobacteriaceae bacterium]
MRSLVHIDGDTVTWSEAVSRVAEALNPVGAVARNTSQIVASLGACAVEIRQIQLESLKMHLGQSMIEQALRQRQTDIARIFRLQYEQAQQVRTTFEELRFGHRAALKIATDFGINEDERMIAHQSAMFYARTIAQNTAERGHQLTTLAEGLHLTPFLTAVRSWPAIER